MSIWLRSAEDTRTDQLQTNLRASVFALLNLVIANMSHAQRSKRRAMERLRKQSKCTTCKQALIFAWHTLCPHEDLASVMKLQANRREFDLLARLSEPREQAPNPNPFFHFVFGESGDLMEV